MKLFTLAAAALAMLAGMAPAAPAAAQPQRSIQERTTVTTRTTVRQDRPRFRPRYRTVCKTRIRRGERVRTCRQVRIYR